MVGITKSKTDTNKSFNSDLDKLIKLTTFAGRVLDGRVGVFPVFQNFHWKASNFNIDKIGRRYIMTGQVVTSFILYRKMTPIKLVYFKYNIEKNRLVSVDVTFSRKNSIQKAVKNETGKSITEEIKFEPLDEAEKSILAENLKHFFEAFVNNYNHTGAKIKTWKN